MASAQLQVAAGQYSAAAPLIDKALQNAPANVRALLLKAELLYEQSGAEVSLQFLQQSTQAHPKDLRLRLALARSLIRQGELEQAQTLFADIASRHPDNGQLRLSLALILVENGLHEQARAQLLQLLERQQETDSAHYYLGRLYEKSGDQQQAIEHYSAVRAGKELLQAQASAARLMIQSGRTELARDHLQQLRDAFPEHSTRLTLVESDLLMMIDQPEVAYQLLTEQLEIQGDDYELLYSRAMVALQLRYIEEMEADLRRILRQEPNNAMVLNTLGYSLTEFTSRYSDALMLIRKAAALKPGDPAITDSLGWVYYKLGQYHEALLFLQQAYDLMQDAEIASHLVEVYWMSGHREEAVATLLEARQLFENSELLQGLERRFPELKAAADRASDSVPRSEH